MLQSKIGRNFLVCFLLLNVVVGALLLYGVLGQGELLSAILPGKFGAALAPELTGNLLALALLLLLNALLFVTFGIGGTWHALWAGLRVSPRKMRWLLHERARLAADIAGVVAVAIQEEEKAEIVYLDRARGLLAVGLVLFALAVPALCMAYVDAAPQGAPIFERGGETLPNSAVSHDDVAKFAVDQLASLALDIPAIFHLRATPIEVNGANVMLGVLVVLYRTLIGAGLLLLFVGMRRGRALLFNALEVAMPVSELVAMDPVLQDGHGRDLHVEPVYHPIREEAPPARPHDHRQDEPRHEPVVHRAHAEPALSDGDVVEVEDAHHVVHHAVIHDHATAHVELAAEPEAPEAVPDRSHEPTEEAAA